MLSQFSRFVFLALLVGCGARSELGIATHGDAGLSDAATLSPPLLAVNGEHSCYRRATGTLVCWGHGPDGTIWPDGGSPSVLLPEAVATRGAPLTVAAHISNNAILLADGTIDAWGFDDAFQRLGDGSGKPQPPPGVSIFSGAQELIPNPMSDFACARKSDGSTYCWGYPPVCTATFPDAGYPATPAPRPDLAPLNAIALAQNFLCGTKDGTLECCGEEGSGMLGDGVTQPGYRNELAPVKLPASVRPVRAYTGLGHACAVTMDRTAWCWGWNPDGQLGDGTMGSPRPIPVAVPGLSHIAQLALGFHHSCARLDDGTARCWGSNSHGQLGDGTTVQRLTPVAVLSPSGAGLLSGIVDLHAGWDFSCGLLSSGEVYCWGWNDFGQLGNGTTTDRHRPTRVVGLP